MASVSAGDPLFGQLLAERYRVLSTLGRGGVAKVYRARQEPLGREVAIKLVRADLSNEQREEFEGRFLREAAMAGRLSHPNVVTVYDYGRTDDGACFIVMELLRGVQLRQLMRSQPMDPELAVRLAAGVAKGLRHAHAAGLVHRDVKPGNIFLVRDDDGAWLPKLLDFGLVKVVDETTVTDAGTILGTPHYIAPEQALGEAEIDGRADLYSLAVILYRMLTGRLPFEADNPMAIAIQHTRATPPGFDEVAPALGLDPALERIVMRCLAKAPEQRYADAGELVRALEDWLDELPSLELDLTDPGVRPAPTLIPPEPDPDEEPTPTSTPAPAPAPPPKRRGRGLAALVVAFSAVAVGAGLGLFWPDAPRDPSAEELDEARAASARARESEELAARRAEEVEQVAARKLRQAGKELDGSLEPATQELAALSPEPGPKAVPAPSSPAPSLASSPAPSPAPSATGPKPVPTAATPTPAPEAGPATPAPTSSPTPPTPAADGSLLFYDGVAMSPAQAAAVLAFANSATEDQLRSAGVYGRGINVVLETRPFATMEALVDTPYIGEKSVRAMLDALP